MRRISIVIALALLAPIGPRAGRTAVPERATLTEIRHTLAPDRTRLVLSLSGKPRYEIRTYSGPDRIAVNLPDVAASRDLRESPIESGIVRRIRVNRLPWGTQVVFDLRRAASWDDHSLDPVDGMPDRIVIDVLASEPQRTEGGTTQDRTPHGGKTAAMDSPAPAAAPAAVQTSGENPGRVLVVAIDAGHGGKDWGAKGKQNLIEKDLALDISKRAARAINDTRGFKAVLTRDKDVFLDLVERTRIAKKKDADVFVSIHLNTAPRQGAGGVEVWLISPAGAESTAKKLLADRDRAAKELGLDEPENGDIMQMLVDVNQQAMMQRSLLLAEEILKATDRQGLPPGRRVKQESFAVLKSIDMPSVLVEAGFLTNAKDAAFLKTKDGRQAIADAVASGVVSYLKKYPPPPAVKSRVLAKKVHRVREGETLWAISKKYNTTVASIRRSNGLSEREVLQVGQELVIREDHDGR
jgi:N-acetylmuramoyl-L-alanine amidase